MGQNLKKKKKKKKKKRKKKETPQRNITSALTKLVAEFVTAHGHTCTKLSVFTLSLAFLKSYHVEFTRLMCLHCKYKPQQREI